MTDNSITVDVLEMTTAFTRVNLYLSTLPKNIESSYAPSSVQSRLDYTAKLWEDHFGIKVHAIWGAPTITLTFKDKETFTLFMLEWS